MSNTKYRVIFKGDIADGRNLDDVKENLASILKADITTIEKLFSGKLIVIKRDADRETCEKFINAFKKAGAICYLEKQESLDIDKTIRITQQPPVQGKNERKNLNVPKQEKGPDEKFCSSCGEIIKKKAVICPKCGVRQQADLSKAALLLFTFFLGGIGGHKFYIGKYVQGVLYFVFFWTGIPSLIALVEFIVYACTNTEKLKEKYKPGGSIAIILIIVFIGFMFFIAVIGIIAAIAIPQFFAYRNRAYQHAVIYELNNFRAAQEAYFGEYNRYARNINNLKFTPGNPEVTIEIIRADQECFEAKGTHKKVDEPVVIDCNSLKNKGR
jgi:TM2 domain-containing membrane protein YozV/Tfp pilus assembly major pilin PilA